MNSCAMRATSLHVKTFALALFNFCSEAQVSSYFICTHSTVNMNYALVLEEQEKKTIIYLACNNLVVLDT